MSPTRDEFIKMFEQDLYEKHRKDLEEKETTTLVIIAGSAAIAIKACQDIIKEREDNAG